MLDVSEQKPAMLLFQQMPHILVLVMSGEKIADLSFIPSAPEFSYHFVHKIFLQMSAESQIAALGIVLPAAPKPGGVSLLLLLL